MNRTPRKNATIRLVLILAAVTLGLGAVTWRKVVRDHFVPRNFGVVDPGVLYRSGRLTPRATRLLREHYGIRTIVDLGSYDRKPDQNEVAKRTAEALGIDRYEFYLVGDGTGNPNSYVAALRIIADPANHPVLVQCSGGSERTSGCVMLYEKAFHGRSFLETYPAMTGFKHDPSDNPRLMSFLADHAEVIIDTSSRGGFIAGFDAFDLKPVASRYALVHRGTGDADDADGADPAVP